MDTTKKTSLEEAKASYQQIKNFATEAAKKELEKEITKSVEKLLKESLSVEVDDENNVTVSTDEKVVELTNDGEVEVEEKEKHDEELGKEGNDEDNEEIEIEKIDEMITFEQEQPQATDAPQVDASAAPVAPPADAVPQTDVPPTDEPPAVEENPEVSDDVMQLAQILDKIIDDKISGTEGQSKQGVKVIDDEKASQENPPVDANTPPSTEVPPAPPVQEDALLEFSLDEISECGVGEGNEMLEFDIPENKEEYIEIGDEPEKKEEPVFEIDEDELEEMKGQSKLLRNTSSRLGKEPREGTPNLKESTNNIKAQDESKLDELLKENKRLNESNKELGEVIKNYQESFKDLRKQFDEMQTFNAKLAYANKIFASGGLSVSDKAMIAEEFDKVQTTDEAKKLYNKILKENKISVSKDNAASKLKTTITNTAKPKNAVFESAEMKRSKVLAGIEKNEDYL